MLTLAAATAPTWPAPTAGNAVIVTSLVLAVVTGFLAWRELPMPRWLGVLVGVVELALVVMTVQCVVAWAGGNVPDQPIVFLAYLIVCLAAAPGTLWWGRAEPGRWGLGVVAIAGLVLPVLVLRLQQVWTGAGRA